MSSVNKSSELDCCCCYYLLLYLHSKQLWSCRDGLTDRPDMTIAVYLNLTILFLSRLRLPERLTSTSYTYSRQLLTTAFLNQRKEKRKYVADQVLNSGPLTLESDALPTALRGPAK